MASVKGVNKTIIDQANGVKLDRQNLGEIGFFQDTYEASSLASGSDISLGATLKAGQVLVDAFIIHDALGASSTLTLGDAGDADRFITAGSSASAGRLNLNAADGTGYEFTADTQLVVTTGGATISGTIKLVVIYK